MNNSIPAASTTIAAHINGEPRALPAGTTIADLVREVLADAEARAVAVARNDAIVPRAEWAATAVIEGDNIEIVRPVQGG